MRGPGTLRGRLRCASDGENGSGHIAEEIGPAREGRHDGADGAITVREVGYATAEFLDRTGWIRERWLRFECLPASITSTAPLYKPQLHSA